MGDAMEQGAEIDLFRQAFGLDLAAQKSRNLPASYPGRAL
jgi:hypothetical protein